MKHYRARNDSKGFTLIELMIAVAIVGILAKIALPAYLSYVNRSKITDAIATLPDYASKMEQYFQDNRNYGTASSACPVTVATSKYFNFSCTVGATTPTTSFTATATSIAGTLGSSPGDYTYTIDQSNNKVTTKFQGGTVTNSCWLIKGNEC